MGSAILGPLRLAAMFLMEASDGGLTHMIVLVTWTDSKPPERPLGSVASVRQLPE